MVCPVCIGTAIAANAQLISVSVGGVIAAKLTHQTIEKRKVNPKKEDVVSKTEVKVIGKREKANIF